MILNLKSNKRYSLISCSNMCTYLAEETKIFCFSVQIGIDGLTGYGLYSLGNRLLSSSSWIRGNVTRENLMEKVQDIDF